MTQTIWDSARGRWQEILRSAGVEQRFLSGKHGPCPLCGGKDRFRFTNFREGGRYFCNQCGPGGGLDLLMKAAGLDYRGARAHVERLVGRLAPKPPPEEKVVDIVQLKRMWDEGQSVVGTRVEAYLRSRGIERMPTMSEARDRHGEMMVVVRNAEGRGIQMQRTVIKPDGTKRKDKPRLMLPGPWGRPSAVWLGGWSGGPLGIAEGVETALSASLLFKVPVWAALSAGHLVEWRPPAAATEVIIFGDADESYTGQHAAFALAKHLTWLKLKVTVRIPERLGEDWNDVLRGLIKH